MQQITFDDILITAVHIFLSWFLMWPSWSLDLQLPKCNQCLSPLTLWVQIPLVTCSRSVVSSTNKTDHHDITEILLKVSLNTINLTEPLGRKTVCFYILQTISERKVTERGVLTKPRLHSGTVYPCHCGMWILWTFLKENLTLTFLELLLRISCRFLVVFRVFDFF